ncbi:MAG: hypothetical protein PHN56_03800 [Candidatus Nanoarchaeia archaeon]|nr:hypothetical protein [Candidatus Nanoarchaeia archaeon]
MFTDYLIRLLHDEVKNPRNLEVPPRISDLTESELVEKLKNYTTSKSNLYELRELHKGYMLKLKRLKYESKALKSLENLIDDDLKHNKHTAIILSMVGVYNFKFKPDINAEKKITINYLIQNYPKVEDKDFNYFYYLTSKDNFAEIEKLANALDSDKNSFFKNNKKLFTVFYGFIAHDSDKTV